MSVLVSYIGSNKNKRKILQNSCSAFLFTTYNRWLADTQKKEFSLNNRRKSQLLDSMSMFTNDIDGFIADGPHSMHERINNYLSWTQISALPKEEKPTFNAGLQSIHLKYQIHGFLNSITAGQNTFERLDAVHLLSYLLVYEDSFSIGERVIRIIRSHEQLNNVFLLSHSEKNLMLYRMLSLCTPVFRVGILAFLVELFFQTKEERQIVNININSLEYQHLSIARAILYFFHLKGSFLDEKILELLLSSYRDYLCDFLQKRSDVLAGKATIIPISEFITGLVALHPNLLKREINLIVIVESFIYSLSLKNKASFSLSENNRIFLEEMLNRLKDKSSYKPLLSRLSLSSPIFSDLFSFNQEGRLFHHVALGFASGKVPYRIWVQSLKDNKSPTASIHSHILACCHIGILSSISKITEVDIKEQLSNVLGPKMLPSTTESISPCLSLSWSCPLLVPFTLSLMTCIVENSNNPESPKNEIHKSLRSWLVLEIINLAFTSKQPFNKEDSKLLQLTSWFRRSSLYQGPVSSVDKLQAKKYSTDKFILFLVTCGGIHLSSIATILNLSCKYLRLVRSSNEFISLLDPHAWISIISYLWERKRYMSIVDFYRLFIHFDKDEDPVGSTQNENNNDISSTILISSSKFKYLTRQSVSDIERKELEHMPLLDHSPSVSNALKELHPLFFSFFPKPDDKFDTLFLNPFIKDERKKELSESILSLDLKPEAPIDGSHWLISKYYRQHHRGQFLNILIISLLIKSEWRLLLGLLYHLRDTLPRFIHISRSIHRARAHIPFLLKYLCGGPYLKSTFAENDAEFSKYDPSKTINLQQELGTEINFIPTNQPEFPDRPYFIIEMVDDKTKIPCKIPSLPDDLSLTLFCNILSLIHWGPFDSDNRLSDENWFLNTIPSSISSVGALRSFLTSQVQMSNSLFSRNEYTVLRLILFTVHIKPSNKNPVEHSPFGNDF